MKIVKINKVDDITSDFRQELYDKILAEYDSVKNNGPIQRGIEENAEPPQFLVTVTPFEREGSNIRGLARIYFDDSFIVNNVNILQGKDKVFVAMPSYKTQQKDRDGKDIYQDICYPVTKDFRAKLYGEIERVYEEAKNKQVEDNRDRVRNDGGDGRDSRGGNIPGRSSAFSW